MVTTVLAKLRRVLRKAKRRRYWMFGILLFLMYIIIWCTRHRQIGICAALLRDDIWGKPRPRVLCSIFSGGIANQMFIYAFSYRMAKERNLELIIDKDNVLTKYFNIYPNTLEYHGLSNYVCSCFQSYEDSLDCGYDETLLSLPKTDLVLKGYFQSWKYWKKYENEIRKAFQFKSHIYHSSHIHLTKILKERHISIKDGITLVGVHIRRGDYQDAFYQEFGYRMAPPKYLKKATDYFRNFYSQILFIVCTNAIEWTLKVLPDEKDVYIVKGYSAIEDMALLSLTNHTIMTVGTFGWMIGWLTGGKVIHYKHPYVIGSRFSKQFHSNYSDHFYPGWIAMN